MSNIPETTLYHPVGGFYYRFLNKSPWGDLGVKIFHFCLTLIFLEFIITDKAVSQNPENPARSIKIGLLVQDSSCTSAIQGAELAILKANEKGGLNDRKFELIVRSMEGPWGTGSKQAVNLIFEEKVWALLGLHDGRNAHLVEQAATKSQVVFLSAWSADPTLSQAFVPWFFNCVPNDNQQAASLTEEIYNKRKFNKVVIISGDDYDSKMTLNSYLNSSKLSGQPDPVQFNFDNYKDKLNTLIDKIREENADCLILFCQPSASIRIVKEIHQKEMKPSVFGSLTILNENLLSVKELREFDNILSIPSGEWTEPENLTFRMEFQNTYNKMPGIVATYSFDAMSVLLEAINNAGSSDREKIQKSLENIRYKGVTGLIQFDNKGNRSGSYKMMKTLNGVPITFKNEITR